MRLLSQELVYERAQDPTERPGRWRALMASVVLLALAASAVGIVNGFAYDDRYIVELNPVVHSLHHWGRLFQLSYWPRSWGGDGYRPLTMLAFAIEWVAGHGRPMVFHAVNIVSYAATAALVFALASLLLPLWAAWLAAALFAVHPVHVEAVANTVGQSELLAALCMLGAMCVYLRARRAAPPGRPLSLGAGLVLLVLYAGGCLAKENGITLPGLLLLAEWLLVDTDASLRTRLTALRPFYLLVLAVAIAYLGIHSLVLSDSALAGFQPFVPFRALKLTNFERILTMFGVVPDWVRLFYWPARLSSEYAPPDVQLAQGIALWQVPGFLLLVGIIGLGFAVRRRRPVMSFGIFWVCVTLLPASNFLVPAGIILAERTLFLPSVGAMLVAADVAWWAASSVARQGNTHDKYYIVAARIAVAAILIAAVVRSGFRSTVWRDNDHLFRQATLDTPLDYRAHYMLGAWDFEQHRKREGEQEYWRAMKLFPFDPFVAYGLATQYRVNNRCAAALPLYKWAYENPGGFSLGHGEYAWCLLVGGQFSEARRQAFLGMQKGGAPLSALRYLVHTADSAMAASASREQPTVIPAGRPGKVPDTVQKTARVGSPAGGL